jgi:hypothetical protein
MNTQRYTLSDTQILYLKSSYYDTKAYCDLLDRQVEATKQQGESYEFISYLYEQAQKLECAIKKHLEEVGVTL